VTRDYAAAAQQHTLEELRNRVSRHSQRQIDGLSDEIRAVLGRLAGVAIFGGGQFHPADIEAVASSAVMAGKLRVLIEELASKAILVEPHQDDYGKGYRFIEDSAVAFLWMDAAGKLFGRDAERLFARAASEQS
jgi:hypothetical protein